jgi:hypothetical protein
MAVKIIAFIAVAMIPSNALATSALVKEKPSLFML